jgi:hypothetical protein
MFDRSILLAPQALVTAAASALRAIFIGLLLGVGAVLAQPAPSPFPPQEAAPPPVTPPELPVLSPAELEVIHTEAKWVRRSIKERFRDRYREWKESWPPTAASSPRSVAKGPRFKGVIDCRSECIPLLVEKLLDPLELPALYAFDTLTGLEFRVLLPPEFEPVGDRARALLTIKRWIYLWHRTRGPHD